MSKRRVKLISLIETCKLKHEGHAFFFLFFFKSQRCVHGQYQCLKWFTSLGPHNICGALYDQSSWGNYIGTTNFLVVRFYEKKKIYIYIYIERERERERERDRGCKNYVVRLGGLPWQLHLHYNLNSYITMNPEQGIYGD